MTAANYTQSFGYDTKGRLTTGPAGAYIYGDSAHEHAVTSTSNGYTAAYDATGDMLCRAPSSSTTCSGTQTGAQLTYDRERRATHWQDTPSSPTSTDDLRYDGEGTRVEQRTVSGGTTTTTYYLLGGQEEVQIVSGGATTITKYYPTGATGLPQPMKVGTTLSYLATDGLDTVSEAVDGAGTVTAQQLYLPYGGSRYSNGTMPTSKGYTGQRADAATGLDYYGARYYDPLVGQFASADDILPDGGINPWGLSRYAYVAGNPIAQNDPSGHCWPVCAIIAAIAVGVVAAAVDLAVQAVQNNGDLSKTNWGQVAGVGVGAAVVTGAVLLTGGAALAAGGAAAGEAAGAGGVVAATEGAAAAAEGTAAVAAEGVAAAEGVGAAATEGTVAAEGDAAAAAAEGVGENPTYVIGRSALTRVARYAAEKGFEFFQTTVPEAGEGASAEAQAASKAATMAENMSWLQRVMDSDARIVDIGLDPNPDVVGEGEYYGAELRAIAERGYQNIFRVDPGY